MQILGLPKYISKKINDLFSVDNLVDHSPVTVVKRLLNSVHKVAPETEQKLIEIQREVEYLNRDLEHYRGRVREIDNCSLDSLLMSFREELENEFEEILESDYPTDILHERADSFIPIYNYCLAQYLANDTSLSEVDDPGLIEGVTCIYKIIQVAIYEHLIAEAYSLFSELKDDKLERYEHVIERLTNVIDSIESDEDLSDKYHDRVAELEQKRDYYQDLFDKLESEF